MGVHKSNIGTPQGIVLSPLFSNIVLHELDVFVEDELKLKFTKGKQRRANPVYRRLNYQIKKDKDQKKKLVKQRLKVYSKDIYDPNFRRLYYVRYVDDWVILLLGRLRRQKSFVIKFLTN